MKQWLKLCLGLLGCIVLAGLPAAAQTAPTFTPTGGTYTSAQSVTIACASGYTAAYTTDGSPPNPASTPYAAPIPISSATTLQALCFQLGVAHYDTQTSSTGYKCDIVAAATFPSGTTCQKSGGGVGSNQPSNVGMTYGQPADWLLSTTATSGETQALFVYFGSGCDTCDHMAQDKTFLPVGDATINPNLEMDMVTYNKTYGVNYQIGLQCNQQPGNSGNQHWQIDSDGGTGWVNTPRQNDCSPSLTVPTHLSLTAHWTNGSTSGPHGAGYVTYDELCTNGTCTDLSGMGGQPLSKTTYGPLVGNQDQIDLNSVTTTGLNPTTGQRKVWHNNVVAWIGPASAVTTATYSFSSTPTVANPTASPAAGTYFAAQSVTLADGTTGTTICYTVDGSTPAAATAGTCSAGTAYSAAIAVSASTTIKALGTLAGDVNSAVVSFPYTISIPLAAGVDRGNIDDTQTKSTERLALGKMFQMTNLGNYSTLPTCNSANTGDTATVKDSTVTAYGATIAGAGTNIVHAWCNGTAWVVD